MMPFSDELMTYKALPPYKFRELSAREMVPQTSKGKKGIKQVEPLNLEWPDFIYIISLPSKM